MTNIFDLPDDSLVRLKSIIGPGNPVPISRSTWFVWRKTGRAPAAVMLSPKVAAYRAGDVKALVRAANMPAEPRG